MKESGFNVPDGWRVEEVSSIRGFVLITSPGDHGMVTVDFNQRTFRSGFSTTGVGKCQRPFKGRGWKQALVNEAIQYLTEATR